MSKATPVPKFKFLQKFKLRKNGINTWEIPTHMTSSELLTLNKLSRSLNENAVCVEVGSYIGASSLIIGKGLNSTSTLYCVDTWNNDAMSEGNKDTLERFRENTAPVKDKIKCIRAWSTEAAKDFNQPIDFLFLDGDHSYDGVKADVNAWLPKLKSGGIVIMHDIGWADGVKKVVTENVAPFMKKEERLPNMYWAWKK